MKQMIKVLAVLGVLMIGGLLLGESLPCVYG